MDIVFVILHYMAIKETKSSVRYIQENLDTENYQIVIVDNASNNGTGKELQQTYQDSKDVTVLINKENQGFAKGNNLGFRYAKNKWDPRYIVLMNNDVFLIEKFLFAKIEKEYKQSHFSVLGPMIMTKDGRCDVNPQKPEFSTTGEIDAKINYYKKVLRRYQYHYAPLYYKLASIKGAFVGYYKRREVEYLKRTENVKLHGSFLIFSKEYIQSFDGLDESTFLFWEEEFLYKHMISNSKIMVYNPEIIVFHKEDAATDAALSKRRDKMIFMLTHYIKSLNELKKVYAKYGEKSREQGKDA